MSDAGVALSPTATQICSDCRAASQVAFGQGFTGLMVMICAIFYFNMLDRRLPAGGDGKRLSPAMVRARINDVLHSMITDQERFDTRWGNGGHQRHLGLYC